MMADERLVITESRFLTEFLNQHLDQAEKVYQRAVKADPKDAASLAYYADFLERCRHDIGQAEEYYHRAVEAAPQDVYNLRNYAKFLRAVRGNIEKADELERRAQSVQGG